MVQQFPGKRNEIERLGELDLLDRGYDLQLHSIR